MNRLSTSGYGTRALAAAVFGLLSLVGENARAASPEVAVLIENPPGPVMPGKVIVYKLHVSNLSLTTPTGAMTLEANIPQHMAVNQPPDGACKPNRCDYTYVARFGGVVNWKIPSLAPGVTVERELHAMIDNTAEYPPPDNGAKLALDIALKGGATTLATATSSVVNQLAPALVDLAVTGTTRAAPGATLDYTFRYGNTGAAAASVLLRVPLPEHTTIEGASKGAVRKGDFVEWDLGKLPAGQSDFRSLRLKLAATVPSNTLYPLTGELKTPAQKYATTASMVTIASAAAPVVLAVTATPDVIAPGGLVLYKIDVTNKSLNAPTGAFVVESSIPENVTVNQPQGGSCHPTRCDYTYLARHGAIVRWKIPSLAPGATSSVQFTALVDKPVDSAPPPNGTILANELVASVGGVVRSGMTVAIGTNKTVGKGAPLAPIEDPKPESKATKEKPQPKTTPKAEEPKAKPAAVVAEPAPAPAPAPQPVAGGDKKPTSGISVKVSGSVNVKTK